MTIGNAQASDTGIVRLVLFGALFCFLWALYGAIAIATIDLALNPSGEAIARDRLALGGVLIGWATAAFTMWRA